MVRHGWDSEPTADRRRQTFLPPTTLLGKRVNRRPTATTQGSGHGVGFTQIKHQCTPRKGGVGDPRGEGHPAYTG
jgi:hypothetical protein